MKKKLMLGFILLTLIVSMVGSALASDTTEDVDEEVEGPEETELGAEHKDKNPDKGKNNPGDAFKRHKIALKVINHFMDKFELTEENTIGELLEKIQEETRQIGEHGLDNIKDALGLDEEASVDEVKDAYKEWMSENSLLVKLAKNNRFFGKFF